MQSAPMRFSLARFVFRTVLPGGSFSGSFLFSGIGFAQFDRFPLYAVAHAQVERLYEYREAHRKIDVALGDVLVQPFHDQSKTDHEQKAQGQNFDGWMLLDEFAD